MIDIFRGLNLDGLTRRQEDVLKFLVEFQFEHGWPPTIREIGERFDIRSPNGVVCHLRALAFKKKIKISHFRSRGIAIVGLRWLPIKESDIGSYDEETQERHDADSAFNGASPETRLQNGAGGKTHSQAAYHG